MPIERARSYFAPFGLEKRIQEFETSSATVELAAAALGVIPARIAKTLAFKGQEEGQCFLVVTAGDAKIDNTRFKAAFQVKAKMLSAKAVQEKVGYAVGGVCPFDVDESIAVYLDVSLKRFASVFPACGSSNSGIELTCDELYRYARTREWVDVCKGWKPVTG